MPAKKETILDQETLVLIEEINKNYSIGKIKSIKLIPNGGQNQAFKIETTQSTFFVRKYRKKVNLQTTIKEVNLITTLIENNAPIPRIIPNKSGSLITRNQTSIFFIQEFVDGNFFPTEGIELNLKQLHASAVTLSSYHKLSERLPQLETPADINNFTHEHFFPQAKALQLWQKIIELANKENDQISRIIQVIAPQKIEQIKLIDEEEINNRVRLLPTILTHGDFTPQNLIFQDNQVLKITDWELARYQPRVWEVTRAICAFCRTDTTEFFNTPIELEKAKAFLDAYQSVTQLTDAEIELIPQMSYLGSLFPEYMLTSKYVHNRNVDHLFPKNVNSWFWWQNFLNRIHI